ncbi:MAG TPA: c-type cytochrome [Acidobacteriota bacterium]|jgi:mono/diheme cytochrome c family protein|nr:c-type cytochrome [Acidobacteriota bacterium]
MRLGLNLLLLGLLAASLLLNWLVSERPEQPNYRFLPEMVDSLAYDAFASNPNFPDGKTLQVPVAGTIARDHMPLRYQPTPEDAVRAGRELENPFSYADTRALSRGQEVFENFCTPCHGSSGRGDGVVARRGFPPPPSLLAEHARSLADGQMFHILTYGQGNMASHASQLGSSDRWSVIVYVRSLQQQAPATPVADDVSSQTSAMNTKEAQ